MMRREEEASSDGWAATEGVGITCEDCGCPALTWFVPNKLWNLVKGGPEATDDPGGMLCPNCFIERAEAAGIIPTAWVLDAEVLSQAPAPFEAFPAPSSEAPAAPPAVPEWVADFLNRRTEVEGELRSVAAGKRAPLTLDECKALANRLSVPEGFGAK